MIRKPLMALRRWIRYRNNLRILSQLDDRTLNDIGLLRADLGKIALSISR